jgi:hypothetical protein
MNKLLQLIEDQRTVLTIMQREYDAIQHDESTSLKDQYDNLLKFNRELGRLEGMTAMYKALVEDVAKEVAS